MTTKYIYENENYAVALIEELDWHDEYGNLYEQNFGVINKEHGVLEFYSPQLAAALFNAESFNNVVVEKPYLWQSQMRQQGAGEIIEGETVKRNDDEGVH